MPIRTLFLSAPLLFFFYLVIFFHLTSVGLIFFLFISQLLIFSNFDHSFFFDFFFACNHFDTLLLSINFSFSSHSFFLVEKNNNKNRVVTRWANGFKVVEFRNLW